MNYQYTVPQQPMGNPAELHDAKYAKLDDIAAKIRDFAGKNKFTAKLFGISDVLCFVSYGLMIVLAVLNLILGTVAPSLFVIPTLLCGVLAIGKKKLLPLALFFYGYSGICIAEAIVAITQRGTGIASLIISLVFSIVEVGVSVYAIIVIMTHMKYTKTYAERMAAMAVYTVPMPNAAAPAQPAAPVAPAAAPAAPAAPAAAPEATKFCSNCGTKCEDDSVFCAVCGTKFE